MLPGLTKLVWAGCAGASVRFAATLQFSRTSASLAKTWSWHHLKRPLGQLLIRCTGGLP